MNVRMLKVLPVVLFVAACSSGGSSETETKGSIDPLPGVIEDVARITVPQKPTVPAEPPETPVVPTPPDVPKEPSEELPPEAPPVPVEVEPHKGWVVARVCSNRMQEIQSVYTVVRESTMHEPKTDTHVVRWKISDEDWLAFVADGRLQDPPVCRVWLLRKGERPVEK